MTGNISYLSDYEPYQGGHVSFRQGGGKITGKGIIKTGKLEFENVYFVKDLKYNLFSVSQICNNKNSVLFTDSECIVLGRDFKLKDDTNVLLKTPRQHNMYSIDLNNIIPHKDLTCLVAKASANECMLWHRRLVHLNFKTMNKLVRHNLVKCLPSKCFVNDHTCVACLKGKQHKASCKTKLVNSVTMPIHTLHMDLFGPTSVSILNQKWYCLFVTDDFSRFTWTFFLKTKDETSGILRNFITEIENIKELKVKIIRCDNGGEFKNKEMNDFCSRKGIKREFSNARIPQQNGVAKKRNRTLIKEARTMLADAKLSVTFWAEAVNTAFYVQNRVLGSLMQKGMKVILLGALCLVKHLGFNKRTKRVEENLHVDFLENKLNKKGAGPNWLFDIDTLTNSMNYVPVVVAGTSSTNFSGTKDAVSQYVKKDVSSLRYIALPNWFHEAHLESSTSNAQDACNADAPESSGISNPTATSKNPSTDQMETLAVESAIPTVSLPVLTAYLETYPKITSGSRLISKGPKLGRSYARRTSSIQNSECWSLVDCPKRVRPIGTKWVLKNKKDERGIVIRNKARLVAQGHTQEEGIDYEEVFAPFARIEAIRLFLAYASFMGFTVYQMDVKSVFPYGTIDEEVYVMQPLRFQDPEFPARVYKVEKAMYGLHHAPRAWYGTLSKYLLTNGFQRGTIDHTLFIRRHRGDFILVQVHQVTPKECHLHAVKRIFRYLKGHPKLGLWYPKDSPFDLAAYSDSDYGGATQDRKSTTGGCQFLGQRLISWQCKKQTNVATSTTEAVYVAAASGWVKPIGTKWVLKNKKDERGIVIRNKARLVAQEHTQEEGIDYEEVFAPIARIEAIRLFLAYASFMGFTVYQMDVKSAFLYGTINEEVYVM
nr:hypothetical protein [Tanacetum cinerariifolium]